MTLRRTCPNQALTFTNVGVLTRVMLGSSLLLLLPALTTHPATARAKAAVTRSTCPSYAQLSNRITSATKPITIALSCSHSTRLSFSQPIMVRENLDLYVTHSSASITFDGGKKSPLFIGQYGVNLDLSGVRLVHGNAASCSAIQGGAIYSDFGALRVSHDSFLGDHSCYKGGAISIDGGRASVINSSFTGSSASTGGAIYATGSASLTINNSTFVRNREGGAVATAGAGSLTVKHTWFLSNLNKIGDGGAINVAGSSALQIWASRLSHNVARGQGGAVYIAGNGSLAMAKSTMAGNSAQNGGAMYLTGQMDGTIWRSTFASNRTAAAGAGGAIYFGGPKTLAVYNSTYFGNRAGVQGGGAMMTQGGVTYVRAVTFSQNAAPTGKGAAIAEYGTNVHIADTIISGNRSGNCFLDGGSRVDEGYNLTDRKGRCGLKNSTDQTDERALLGRLGNYGGPTQTVALESGSPAIARIPKSDCLAIDQRGRNRPTVGHAECDIGSFERSSAPAK